MRLNGGHGEIRTRDSSVQTRCDTRLHQRPINHQCNSVKIRFTASYHPQFLNNLEAKSNICLLSFSCSHIRKKICSPLTNHHQLRHQMSMFLNCGGAHTPAANQKGGGFSGSHDICNLLFVCCFFRRTTCRHEISEKLSCNYACSSMY